MKKLLTTLSCLVALAAAAQAATINWANGGGRGHAFFLADGITRVAAGSLIEVGFFATASDPTTPFTLFGTTTMGDPGAAPNNIGGHIPGTGRSIVSAVADGNTLFQGKQLSLRIYNAVTAGAATQIGIFTSALWTTPGDPGFNDSSDSFLMTVGVSAAPNTIGAIALDPVGPAAAGTYAVGTVTVGAGSNTAGSIYTLAQIPEPSVTALLGLLGLVGLRRKR